MKNSLVVSTVVAAVFATASLGAALAAPAAAPAAPAAKAAPATILFLDRAAVLRQSAVGKDMAAQVDAMVKKLEADFAPEDKKLQADMQALQSSGPEAPELHQQKIKDLETRREAFRQKVEARNAQVQAGLAQARQKVEQALAPILNKLMDERGANLLLDRGLVVLGQTDLDVTTSVIGRLNTALPKVAVTLATPAAPGAPAAPPPNH